MTYTIPVDSPKALLAAEFGRELMRAAVARNVTLKELERSLGIGHTTLWNYRAGRTLPRIEVATTLAVALDWPKLRGLVVKARTRTCGRSGCRATFINDIGSEARRYCSPSCGHIAANVRQAAARGRSAGQTGSPQAKRAQVQRLRSGLRIADDRARLLSDAIAAMCADCEPEGLCRTAGCPLRAHSPFPLAAHGNDEPRPGTAYENRRSGWTPERRAGQVEANARRWNRPGERERQSERTAAMHASRTPDELAAVIAKSKASYPAERRSVTSKRAHAARRRKDDAA